MLLNVTGVLSLSWVAQNGGWTERSTDRQDLDSGAVALAVDVAPTNHTRAMYNMLLAAMVILILLAYVATLNYTIWKVRLRAAAACCWCVCV